MSLETKDIIAAAKRRPIVFACGALCVVLALAYYFRMDVPGELQTRLAEREKELTRLSNNLKFSAQLDAQLESLRKANATIEGGALRASDLLRNHQLFQGLESATGVKLLDFRQAPVAPPAKGAAPGGYVFIPFTLTVQGDYAQWIEFLKRLDRVATLSRLRTASVGLPVDGVQSVSITVELLGFRT